MKKLVYCILGCFILSSCANQQHLNQFYSKYKGTENTTYVDAPLFLAAMFMDSNDEYLQLKKKIKSIRVLTMQDLQGERNIKVQNDIKTALQKDGFENWFSMNEGGEIIDVSTQNRGKSLKNIVISMQDSDQLIFINAKTNLTEAELANFFSKTLKNKN